METSTVRATYKTIPTLIGNYTPYTHGSSDGYISDGGRYYIVRSYDTIMAIIDTHTGISAINCRKYSQTTSRLQTIIRCMTDDGPGRVELYTKGECDNPTHMVRKIREIAGTVDNQMGETK